MGGGRAVLLENNVWSCASSSIYSSQVINLVEKRQESGIWIRFLTEE